MITSLQTSLEFELILIKVLSLPDPELTSPFLFFIPIDFPFVFSESLPASAAILGSAAIKNKF